MSKKLKVKDEKDENNINSALEEFNKGIEYSKSKNFQEALKSFHKVIKIDPNFPKVWFQLGYTQSELGNIEKAIKSYEKAVSLESEDYEAWYNLGNLDLNNLFNYNKAIECYKKTIEINPEFSFAWNNMGFAYSKLENYQKALECHEKAVQFDPKNESAWVNLGAAHYFLGNYIKAFESFEKAIELDPQDNNAWISLEAAARSYEIKLELGPQYKDHWLILGDVFIKLNRYESAIDCFKKIIKFETDNFEAWHKFGLIYQKLNSIPKFLEYFKKSTELFKDLQKISIVTTSQGPISPDVYWLFEYSSDITIIPSEQQDSDLLVEAQRLPDFDNETFIKAMSSAEDNIFVCWEK